MALINNPSINASVFDRLRTGGDAVIKHGVILPDKHPVDPSLYKVNIGDMTASATGRMDDGIWCTNAITPYTRFRDMNNNPVSFGQYFPLIPYTPVTVLFPSGGAGQGMITALAKTNTDVPDPENRDNLYMVAQTPKGSHIAIDDKTNNIQIVFEKGNTSVVLADNVINLEIGKGDASGKASDTSLSMSKGSFVFKTRDAMMKFDESGFTIGFDSEEGQEKSSSFQITRDAIKMQGGKSIQLNAQDSISTKSEKVTVQGTKDASLVGNQVKVNGAQITSIKGNQVEVEGFWNVQLKAMHIGVQANIKYTEESSIKHVTNLTQLIETNGIAVQQGTFNNTYFYGTNLTFAAFNATFPESQWTNSLAAGAILAYEVLEATTEIVHEGLKAAGQAWMAKVSAISVVTNILGTGAAMAGAGNRSENPSKFLFNAKDKNSTKSLNSGIATTYSRKNEAMENLSVVDPLIQASMTALYTGGGSPASAVSPDTQWALEMGLGGVAEEATRSSGNIIGLDTAGITMTDSVAMLAPSGTCSTMRKGCASGGSEGDEPPKCGEDSYNKFKEEEEKAVAPFLDHLLTDHIVGGGGGGHGGGSCGGSMSHSSDSGSMGGHTDTSYSDNPCPPGYTPDPGTGDCIVNGAATSGSSIPCTNTYSCGACPSGRRCSEGQCA